MDVARPPSRFLRPPPLLGCCIGIGTMFRCLIHQFVNSFTTSSEPEEEVFRSDLEPDYPSSLQIGPVNDADQVQNNPSSSASAKDASNSEKAWSCRSDELKEIKDQITSRSPPDLEVVPIVGMAGIGKTTLAKRIYEDTEVSRGFHLCAWTTVSQQYKLRNVLLDLLSSMDRVPNNVSQFADEELEEKLYRNLRGRRFLIVLDDIWFAKTWNDLKRIIPDDNNGSRVILTSRLMEVARDAEPSSSPHYMNCLTDEESWKLLSNEVFAGKPCPCDLVKIGQKIAKKCQGLPLAIVVVAGHLSLIDKKQHCWAGVVEELDSLISRSEEKIFDILCLSYNCLPSQLKACFLYMGIFPKNSWIKVWKLIRLWNSLGFFQSVDEAEKCLEDLIDRNLIMVREMKCDGSAKSCGIHDLLWDLSSREAEKEGHQVFSQFKLGLSPFTSITDDMNHLMELTSSYRYLGDSFETVFPLNSSCFSFLMILDIQSESFDVFPETITYLVGLRYLELQTARISGSISKLCNLETLINRYKGLITLPLEIWLLRNLRHLEVGKFTLDIPDDWDDVSSIEKSPVLGCPDDLQTLTSVRFDSCVLLDFSSFPNLKRLKIYDIIGDEDEILSMFLSDLIYLHRLEKLNLHFSHGVRRLKQIPWSDYFPHTVKQLTLYGSRLQWENMNILAQLPNIEVLKLKKDAFEGATYEQTVEGFPRLKVLLFEKLGLEYWIADTIHYPILEHLVLKHCSSLKEIPSCFCEISTLKSIKFCACFRSGEKAVKVIQQEQQSMGNDLQVSIISKIFCDLEDLFILFDNMLKISKPKLKKRKKKSRSYILSQLG